MGALKGHSKQKTAVRVEGLGCWCGVGLKMLPAMGVDVAGEG